MHSGVALDDLHDLVAVRMPLPRAFAGEFRREDAAVAVLRQFRERAFPLRFRRFGRAAAQRLQLAERGLQIDNGDHCFPPSEIGSSGQTGRRTLSKSSGV
jgi:hypothetical protein